MGEEREGKCCCLGGGCSAHTMASLEWCPLWPSCLGLKNLPISYLCSRLSCHPLPVFCYYWVKSNFCRTVAQFSERLMMREGHRLSSKDLLSHGKFHCEAINQAETEQQLNKTNCWSWIVSCCWVRICQGAFKHPVHTLKSIATIELIAEIREGL